MATRLVDVLHDVALIEHHTGTGSVWSWTCQLCSSWGYGAHTETAALTEIADHVTLFCLVGAIDGADPG